VIILSYSAHVILLKELINKLSAKVIALRRERCNAYGLEIAHLIIREAFMK